MKRMKKKMELEDLAVMVNNGFEELRSDLGGQIKELRGEFNQELNGVKQDISEMKIDISDMNARMRDVEREVSYIHDHMVYRDEFEDLSARVKYVEIKLGIESGK